MTWVARRAILQTLLSHRCIRMPPDDAHNTGLDYDITLGEALCAEFAPYNFLAGKPPQKHVG